MNIDLEHASSLNGTNLIEGEKAKQNLIDYVRSKYDLSKCHVQLHLIKPAYPTRRSLASEVSIRVKNNLITRLGAVSELYIHPEFTPASSIEQVIMHGNIHNGTAGIIIQMPVESQYAFLPTIIDQVKDIDSLNPSNTIWQYCATAEAATRVLIAKRQQLQKIAVVGANGFVGRDIVQALQQHNLGDGQPTLVDIHDSIDLIRNSATIVSAAGSPGIIRGIHLAHNPFLGIDIGNTPTNDGFFGDFDFPDVDGHINYLTPVPHGMGPLEMTMITERIVRNFADLNFFVTFVMQ